MKRSYANKPKSSKVIDFSYNCEYIDNEDYIGYVGCIGIEKVAQPVIRMIGDNLLKLGDVGYTWIQTFPKDKNYSITTMFDKDEDIVEWYIDIIENVDIDEDGVPFYDDLYLDIVALPNGEIFLLDEDELDEAYSLGDINKLEYDLANSQIDIILDEVVDDLERLEIQSRKYLDYMKNIK